MELEFDESSTTSIPYYYTKEENFPITGSKPRESQLDNIEWKYHRPIFHASLYIDTIRYGTSSVRPILRNGDEFSFEGGKTLLHQIIDLLKDGIIEFEGSWITTWWTVRKRGKLYKLQIAEEKLYE